ncbi:MAG: hypothetical protein U0Y96_03730 [Candidatus Kapaibacterium sp.]|nr:hypothetical protein [Bacteroidota bacterium]
MKITFSIILLLGFYTAVFASQDSVIVYLRPDSTVISGRLLQSNSVDIVLRIDSNRTKVVRRIDIFKLERPGYTDSTFDVHNNITLGATVGWPVLFNIRIGKQYGDFAYHLSGMHYGIANGIQGNLMYCIAESHITQLYISGMIGANTFSSDNNGNVFLASKTYNYYYGGGFVLHSHGFFFEAGVAPVKGVFSTPELLFQFGQMFRW